jgi:sugar lactone lactonase YvrE
VEGRSDTLITTVKAGRYSLGEGPVWDDRTQTLLWVDILAGVVVEYAPGLGTTQCTSVGEHVGCIALTGRPRTVVAALRSGWHCVNLATGEKELIAVVEDARPDCRFNDGAVDPAGRLWTGSLEDGEINPVGCLYRLDSDLVVTTMDRGFLCSNGIDWSRDGRWMYFVDSRRGAIYRYGFDSATGMLAERELFVDTGAMEGIPDGLCVDADGLLWCAFWDGAAVHAFDGDGRLVRTIGVPVLRPTSLAFGGADLDTLYVTSARLGLTKHECTRWPASGSLLAISTVGRGRAPYIFQQGTGDMT